MYFEGQEADRKAARQLGVNQDITERKQAELERRGSETRLREANEKLQKLAGHLEAMLENERLRIARELHDDLGSTLSAIKWAVAISVSQADEAGSPADSQLAQALQLLDSAVEAMRRVTIDLRPSVLGQLGVWAAIQLRVGQARVRHSPCVCRLEEMSSTRLLGALGQLGPNTHALLP